MLIGSEDNQRHSARPATRPAVIQLENVGVRYRAPQERFGSFKEYAIRLIQGRIQHQQFKALHDISLEVRQGEVFGVIGRNGAGKSTLLKVISRVLKPTQGRVVVRGRSAPLLELGAGFHPELSGRENIFLNGTLLGYSHAQVEEQFDDILAFAELEDFVDAPLRTYSTGMVVRLGFAVATAIQPDLLIVDEVLSVGDERFQQKCAARMSEFRQSGTTILLVTHDARLVISMCDRALWLDHGTMGAIGAAEEVVEAYHQSFAEPASRRDTPTKKKPAVTPRKTVIRQPGDRRAPTPLETLALEKLWFYPFELPGGQITPCFLPESISHIHTSRWDMLEELLPPLAPEGWQHLKCLDLGCNQGFFSLKLGQLGCGSVVGVDVRPENIQDAALMRRIYNLDNVQFKELNLHNINPQKFDSFDVVLLFGLLYQLENPLGALRLAKALAKRAVFIETQIAPDSVGEINWGAHFNFKSMHGSFAVIDQAEEIDSPFCSPTGLSLCPGRESLLWLLKRLGFSRVEVVQPPPDAYEQLLAGKRVMIAAYV